MIPVRNVRTVTLLFGWLVAAVLTVLLFTRKEPTPSYTGPIEELDQGSSQIDKTRTTVPGNILFQSDSESLITTLDPVPPPPTLALLLTYMRSGSTFTADVIQEHPDVFYKFEPLHQLYAIVKRNGEFRRLFMERKPDSYLETETGAIALEIIENFLTCRLQDLDVLSLVPQSFLGYEKKMKKYAKCVQNRGLHAVYRLCLPELMQACSSSRLSLVKTIRLSMVNASRIMQQHPNLKLIYLLRDFRATILSQISWEGLPNKDPPSEAHGFCSRVWADLEEFGRLTRLYPDRLMLVRYEDLAEKPMEGVAALYDFLGLEFDHERRQFVKNNTQAGTAEEDCPVCSRRANSTATAHMWRQKIDPRLLQVVQRECASVLKWLGYIPVEAKDVANMSVPTRRREIPFMLREDV